DIAAEDGRRADDQAVAGDVARHQRARANHRKPADSDVRQDDGSRADGRAIADVDVTQFPVLFPLQRSFGRDGARPFVVGKAGIGPEKHAIFNRRAMIDGDVVLYLHHIADDDVEIDVDALANNAIGSDARSFSYLRLVPDAGSLAD